LKWYDQGIQVLGHIQTPDTFGVPFHWPFTLQHVNVSTLVTTAVLISLLGLFESSLTAKSLRRASGGKNLLTLRLDADQELVALGAANVIGGCFLALPSFGGYGRSKLNYSTGGRTPMSNVLVSAMTLICICFLLPAFYYLPRGVLSAMIAVVGVSMIEESPHEVAFFVKIRAWPELTLMTSVFGATVFYSVSLGMVLGLGWSITALILHKGWRSTVHILDSYSAQALDHAEFAQIATLCTERTLLITVTGAFTFAHTSSLRDQLDELDHTATIIPASVHHSTSETQANGVTVLIFDMRHCLSVDGCAVQALTEIAEQHASEETKIIIWEPLKMHGQDPIQVKLTLSGASDMAGGNIMFVSSMEEILTALDAEERPGSIFEALDT
jgi:MFS superfamily sulfate permease-like transporter